MRSIQLLVSVVIFTTGSTLLLLREIKVGDPNDPDNMLGALVSKEHMAKVKGYIDLARNEGCSIPCGDGVDELSLPEQNKNVRVYTKQHFLYTGF